MKRSHGSTFKDTLAVGLPEILRLVSERHVVGTSFRKPVGSACGITQKRRDYQLYKHATNKTAIEQHCHYNCIFQKYCDFIC